MSGGRVVIVRHRFFAIGQWLGEGAELVDVESTKVKHARFMGLAGYFCFPKQHEGHPEA
jgi:hypothetical protein